MIDEISRVNNTNIPTNIKEFSNQILKPVKTLDSNDPNSMKADNNTDSVELKKFYHH